MKQALYPQLSQNMASFKAMFGDSTDFYARSIRICGCDAAILMFEGLGSLNILWNIFLDAVAWGLPFSQQEKQILTGGQLVDQLLLSSQLPTDNAPVEDFAMAVTKLTAGMALILVDGSAKGIALSVQDMKFRSVSEPASEGNLRGSREGFCDLVRINVSLLRRLVRTDDLVIEIRQSKSQNKGEYALCYDRTKAPQQMIRQLKQRLDAADPAMLLDSSYFAPWLCPAKLRLFTPAGYTERPVVAAAKICEGKAILLVNGSPTAMILPFLFAENFDCLDDYGGTAYFASFVRLLKYFSFYITVLLPGIFVAAAVYTPELIPPPILYKIAAAEKATPLPLFAEMLLVIVLLEMIREAGLRMPQSLGHSVSLVAALIIGDAAISTGILSTPCIIVASVTSIAMFLTPSLYEPATVLRIVFLLAGGLAGPVGIAFGTAALTLHLSQLNLFSVYYTAEVLPFSGRAFRDGLIRRSYRTLSQKPYNIREDRHEEN